MNKKIYKYLFLLLAGIYLSLSGCDDESSINIEPQLKSMSIESYQIDLLNIAFEVSSVIPEYPHIKTRCLEQQNTVEACLELNQPQMAFEFIKQITNWRKQLCYANLAFYCAKQDYKQSDVQYFLNLAEQVPDNTEDWRKDHVDSKISQTKNLLEQSKQKSDNYEKAIEELDKLISTGNFDAVQNAIDAYSGLYNKFFSNTERRTFIENKIKSSWEKMPVLVRIEFVLGMSQISLDNGDKEQALKLVNESRKMMDSETWPPRYGIPLLAKIAKYHALSGDRETSKSEIKEALDMYNDNLEQIVNIDKAGVLRPIAEAYIAAGDITNSHNTYKQALEAGIENPNSRPRAEDLSATCRSMALSNVKPEQELLIRINEIKENLSDPW